MNTSPLRHLLPLLLCGLIAGCTFKGGTDPSNGEIPANTWIPHPTQMRVYPGSRFTELRGRGIVQAQIELMDEMGDAIKAAGYVHLSLHRKDGAGGDLGEQLYAWDIDLLTLSDQRKHWNRVTRTYLFRLSFGNQQTPTADTVLVAVFTPLQGSRLRATLDIE